MDADLDTLCTALYVRADDELKMRPELARRRPRVGIAPKLSDAELITLAVVQALLGFSSETRFLRYAVTIQVSLATSSTVTADLRAGDSRNDTDVA